MRNVRTLVAGTLTACLSAGLLTALGPPATAVVAPIRINSGSAVSTTVDGVAWLADRYAVGGTASRAVSPVVGSESAVASTIRYGMAGYKVPVPNGSYDVRLLMAETFHQAAGKRVFDVNIENVRVLSSLDLYATAGGSNRPVSRTYATTVKDGVLDVGFGSLVDHPSVSGLVISPRTTATALVSATVPVSTATAAPAFVNVDTGASVGTTAGGVTWSADKGYVGGAVSSRITVSGASAPGVYGSIRYGMSGYDIAVPNGTYDVTLRMAETYHRGPGQRVFDARIEGRTVLSRFDVFAAAGGYGKPVDRTARTTVNDGRIDIDYTNRVDKATVSGITVVPVPSTSTPTPIPTTTAAPAPTTAAPAPAPAPTTAAPAPPLTEASAGYPFSNRSLWRQPVSDAPLHPNSSGLVRHLSTSVTSRYNGVATFNVWNYNSSFYTVESSVPRTTVKFDNCQNKSSVPAGLYDGDKHFVSVPVPAEAVAATGSDGALVIYSPSTDQLWEFWRASKRADGWYACWGGRMDFVSTNIGHFSGAWGTTATGLPHAAGQISLADVRSGSINHAMALILAEPATYKVTSWPAQRSDGWSTHPDAVPEGLRLRLDPSVDVDALNLHPVARMVAKSAQTYGFVVVDKAGATGVYTESGIPEKNRTGTDPWVGILGKTPSYEVMRNFPWDNLQAMPMHYGKP